MNREKLAETEATYLTTISVTLYYYSTANTHYLITSTFLLVIMHMPQVRMFPNALMSIMLCHDHRKPHKEFIKPPAQLPPLPIVLQLSFYMAVPPISSSCVEI